VSNSSLIYSTAVTAHRVGHIPGQQGRLCRSWPVGGNLQLVKGGEYWGVNRQDTGSSRAPGCYPCPSRIGSYSGDARLPKVH